VIIAELSYPWQCFIYFCRRWTRRVLLNRTFSCQNCCSQIKYVQIMKCYGKRFLNHRYFFKADGPIQEYSSRSPPTKIYKTSLWIWKFSNNHNIYITVSEWPSLSIRIMIFYQYYLEVYSIEHYVVKFVSALRQVGGFLRIIRFPPPI
jgi:hypothetical protein